MGPALRKAHDMLRDVEAERKRVVCLTDGQSMPDDFDGIARTMRANGIRLSTIGVGGDVDDALLARLAELGEGEYFQVYNPKTLPRVLVDSVQIINKPLIKESPFTPVVNPTGSTLAAGMDAAPQLEALVVTGARDDPTAIIEMTHPEGEPLLAHWQAGLGRVAAFTSDLGGAWTSQWRDWPGAAAFWVQLARSTARPAMSREHELITTIADGRLNIALEAMDDEQGFMDYLIVRGTVYTPEGEPVPVHLQQVAPGRYETSIAAKQAGNYVVALSPRRGNRSLAPVIGGASRTTGEEFRRHRSDRPRLEQVAALTRGRVLDLNAPEQAALFDRDDMPITISLLPIWATLLLATLGCFIADVACRRIAWSSADIQALIARALRKAAPAGSGGAEATATLASLRASSDTRTVDRTQSAQQVETLRSELQARQRAEAAVNMPPPPPPDQTAMSRALRTLLGRGKSTPDAPSEPTPVKPPPPMPEIPDEERASETTSGLLAAKRRARKELGERED
jgi:hypothetical protein